MQSNLAHNGANVRSEPRDEVYHRARAMRRDGRTLSLTLVNISPHGLMARCEEPLEVGERLSITLPIVGLARAEVRWALGGRIGCLLDPAVAPGRYWELLARLRG